MKKIIIILLLVSMITSSIEINALNTGFINGVYTVFCNKMCFDLLKNPVTKGYDPNFLKLPSVKQVCIDAKDYGKSMGFCNLISSIKN